MPNNPTSVGDQSSTSTSNPSINSKASFDFSRKNDGGRSGVFNKPKRQPKGSWGRWIALYIIAASVDIFQVLIDLTGIGVILSEYLDIMMAFTILAYMIFVVKLRLRDAFRWGRLMSIVTSFGLDAITLGAAPVWILDVWYLHRSVKKDDIDLNLPDELEQLNPFHYVRKPLNEDGRRNPILEDNGGNQPNRPLNIDGVRQPSTGASKTTAQNLGPQETRTTGASTNYRSSYDGRSPASSSSGAPRTSTTSGSSGSSGGGNSGGGGTGGTVGAGNTGGGGAAGGATGAGAGGGGNSSGGSGGGGGGGK